MLRRCLSAVILASSVIAPALADDAHPPLAPTRDVVVSYLVQTQNGGNGGESALTAPVPVTVSFAGDGTLLRIDANGGKSVTILDRKRQIVTLVSMAQKAFLQFHPRDGLHNPFLLNLSMHFKRAGMAMIAGVSCNRWVIQSDHGNAEACVTDDGVILSESGADGDGAQGKLAAQSVRYGALAAPLFQPPPGFEELHGHGGMQGR